MDENESYGNKDAQGPLTAEALLEMVHRLRAASI